jgi:hypothetical protein
MTQSGSRGSVGRASRFYLTFRGVRLSLGQEALGFGDLVGCHFLGELFNGWPILATFPSPSGPYVASPTSFQSCHLFDL